MVPLAPLDSLEGLIPLPAPMGNEDDEVDGGSGHEKAARGRKRSALTAPEKEEKKTEGEVLFRITNDNKVGVLKESSLGSEVVGHLEPGAYFSVVGAFVDEQDGRRYLRLADDSGWVPTHSRKDASKKLVEEVVGDEREYDMNEPMSAAGPPKKAPRGSSASAAPPPKKVKTEPQAAPKADPQPRGKKSPFTEEEKAWIAEQCSTFFSGVPTAEAPALHFLRNDVAIKGLQEGVFADAVDTENKDDFFKFVERVRHVARSWPDFLKQAP